MTKVEQMQSAYKTSEKFRDYVNACAMCSGQNTSDILTHRTTYEYFLSIQTGGCNEEKKK